MKFFNTLPKKDDPFSQRGFMAGIAKLALAWENLTVNGGKLTWSGLGVPTLTIDNYGEDDNLLPSGSATEKALKWDNADEVWVKSLPIHATDDIIAGTVAEDDYVVVGAKTAPDGSLIRLQTQKMGPYGPDDNLLPGGAANQALKHTDEQWISLPILAAVDKSSGSVQEGDPVVVAIRTSEDGLIQVVTRGLMKEDETPDEPEECAPDDAKFPSDIDDLDYPSSYRDADEDDPFSGGGAGGEGDSGLDFPSKVDACW